MRKVYMISGGVSRFQKARPDKTFPALVQEAFSQAYADLPKLKKEHISGSVGAYFSDHFHHQLMASIMAHDALGLSPKPSKRVEGGGATGGLCFQSAYEAIASGRMDLCVAFGFETMSRVRTWKGNEFIAMASDMNFDTPLGGFYTGYYALMVVRHMYEFGTTVNQMAKVSVKNHENARFNPFAQSPGKLTVRQVRRSPMIAYPLTRLDCCVMSDGAAVAILASEKMAQKLCSNPILISGVGSATDTMRLADRPFGKVPLLPKEKSNQYKNIDYPGVHSCRAGRLAARDAYKTAKIKDPLKELDFVELHDAFTSSEIQAYEDLGLCPVGKGGDYIDSGHAHYGGKCPVNLSGGLIGFGHAIGATGLMQAVYAFWQLQGNLKKHFGNTKRQLKKPKRGLIHSHGGTGTYVTVSILEKP